MKKLPAVAPLKQKAPPPPKWFSPLAKRIYKDTTRQLMSQKVMTSVDFELLVAYCQEYSTYLDIMKKFQPGKDGKSEEEMVITNATKNGTSHQVNPLFKIAQASLEKAKAIGVEFGLTPSSRSRVNPIKEEPKDQFTEFLKSRKA
jgi:P27 family predicted phage terminase small subunit